MVALFQAIVSGLALGAIYGLVALSFNITYSTSKTFNFGQGDFLATGGLIGVSVLLLLAGKPHYAHLLPEELSLPGFALAVGISIVMLAVGGVLLYFSAIRPFVGKGGLNWVISTIGFGIIVQSGALAIWGPASIAVPSPVGDRTLHIWGIGVRPQEILIGVAAIAVMIALDVTLRHTRFGKALRAVSFSPQAATLAGINVERVMISAFALSSGLAGLAGLLIAPVTTASVFLGLNIALKAFSAAIVGGLTNPRGCILGGFLLGILEAVVALWHAELREITIFTLIIVTLVTRPSGILGQKIVEKI